MKTTKVSIFFNVNILVFSQFSRDFSHLTWVPWGVWTQPPGPHIGPYLLVSVTDGRISLLFDNFQKKSKITAPYPASITNPWLRSDKICWFRAELSTEGAKRGVETIPKVYPPDDQSRPCRPKAGLGLVTYKRLRSPWVGEAPPKSPKSNSPPLLWFVRHFVQLWHSLLANLFNKNVNTQISIPLLGYCDSIVVNIDTYWWELGAR